MNIFWKTIQQFIRNNSYLNSHKFILLTLSSGICDVILKKYLDQEIFKLEPAGRDCLKKNLRLCRTSST